MVLPPSFSIKMHRDLYGKMGEIETVEAEKMGWIELPRRTSYPTFPYGLGGENCPSWGKNRRKSTPNLMHWLKPGSFQTCILFFFKILKMLI